jgi:hypothetical protein
MKLGRSRERVCSSSERATGRQPFDEQGVLIPSRRHTNGRVHDVQVSRGHDT